MRIVTVFLSTGLKQRQKASMMGPAACSLPAQCSPIESTQRSRPTSNYNNKQTRLFRERLQKGRSSSFFILPSAFLLLPLLGTKRHPVLLVKTWQAIVGGMNVPPEESPNTKGRHAS